MSMKENFENFIEAAKAQAYSLEQEIDFVSRINGPEYGNLYYEMANEVRKTAVFVEEFLRDPDPEKTNTVVYGVKQLLEHLYYQSQLGYLYQDHFQRLYENVFPIYDQLEQDVKNGQKIEKETDKYQQGLEDLNNNQKIIQEQKEKKDRYQQGSKDLGKQNVRQPAIANQKKKTEVEI